MSLHDYRSLATLAQPALLTRQVTARYAPLLATDQRTGLQCTVGPSPGIIFLGYLYPRLTLPVGLPDIINPEDLCTDLTGTPDPLRLAIFLTLSPPAMRAMYQHCLGLLDRLDKAGELPADMSEPLLIERKLWGRVDAGWMHSYVDPHLKTVRDGRHEHWLWQRDTRGKRPHVTWRTTPSVPVQRLLWHESKPQDLLLPTERLQKDLRVCPDQMYRNCVNPAHFDHALKQTDARLPDARSPWERSSEPSYHHRWDLRDITYEGHVPVVRCPAGHRFSEIVQRNVRDMLSPLSPAYNPHPSGTSKCATCLDALRAIRGTDALGRMNRRPRGRTGRDALRESQAQRDRAYREQQRAIDQGRWDDVATEPGRPLTDAEVRDWIANDWPD